MQDSEAEVEDSEAEVEDSEAQVVDSEAAAESILLRCFTMRVPDMKGFSLLGEAQLNV